LFISVSHEIYVCLCGIFSVQTLLSKRDSWKEEEEDEDIWFEDDEDEFVTGAGDALATSPCSSPVPAKLSPDCDQINQYLDRGKLIVHSLIGLTLWLTVCDSAFDNGLSIGVNQGSAFQIMLYELELRILFKQSVCYTLNRANLIAYFSFPSLLQTDTIEL
jgi:hypothetical protein